MFKALNLVFNIIFPVWTIYGDPSSFRTNPACLIYRNKTARAEQHTLFSQRGNQPNQTKQKQLTNSLEIINMYIPSRSHQIHVSSCQTCQERVLSLSHTLFLLIYTVYGEIWIFDIILLFNHFLLLLFHFVVLVPFPALSPSYLLSAWS